MNRGVLIAPSFEATYDSLKKQLPQSILLIGAKGVGINFLARDLATNLEAVISGNNGGDKKNVISVDDIRELYKKTASGSKERTVIIENISSMTIPAQNAFLKLLEEPPRGMHFILTSYSQKDILPTIPSRVTLVRVPTLSEAQSRAYLDGFSNLDAKTKEQLFFLYEGKPADIYRIATNDDQLATVLKIAADATTFVSIADYYQKLKILKDYNSKESLVHFIEFIMLINKRLLALRNDLTYLKKADGLAKLIDDLSKNASLKLVSLRLVLE